MVEINDKNRKNIQIWESNMTEKSESIIKKANGKSFVKVTFYSDFEKLFIENKKLSIDDFNSYIILYCFILMTVLYMKKMKYGQN